MKWTPEAEVMALVQKALASYKAHAEGGERFSDLYARLGKEAMHLA